MARTDREPFTVVANPMLGYAAITFTLLALLVATWAAWRAPGGMSGDWREAGSA